MGKEYKFSLEGTDIVIERCGKKFVVQIAKDTPYITKVVSYGKIPRQTHLIPFLSYQDILKNVSEFIYYEWDVQPGEKRVPTRKEIYAAFEILKEGNRGVFGELSFARANHLNTIVSYICDYPEEYNGNLIGLTRRSLAYHHEIYNNHIRNLASYENHPPDTKTAVPPFQVEIPGCEIIFLDTVKAIIEEGAKMLHCVGSYTSSAVAGACFLYHVKYKDSEATLQIGKDGRVIQCYGPQNQKNDASRKVLTKKKICLESPG